MDAAIRRTIRARIYDFFTTRIVYHTLFWSAMLLTLIMLDNSNQGMGFKVVREIINIGFYGIVVYFNLFYLIPNYLSEKKFLLYCVLLILSVILITPIKIFVFATTHTLL